MLKKIKKYSVIKTLLLIGLMFLVNNFIFSQQKVGVVLSGGGAWGIAHIGVLKALEANGINIDYIAGTSMGALIGGLYASGYTIEEIEKIFTSKEFVNLTSGKIENEYVYFYKQHDANAAWTSIKLNIKDNNIKPALPTNVISPYPIDFALQEFFASASAVSKNDFDSLYIPFRCVASEITDKKTIVFRNGNLANAIRASITYPFYIKPITINGKLMFDGGLYNNFPTDVMLNDFFPDIIIGSNVTHGNPKPPKEDDLVSQIKNMMITKSNFNKVCDNMVLIEPRLDYNLFDFSEAEKAIQIGYETALSKIDMILTYISDSTFVDTTKRAAFNQKKLKTIVVDSLKIKGLTKPQKYYVQKILKQKKDTLLLADFKRNYFRLAQDDKIKSMYPILSFNPESQKFNVDLEVKPEKDIEIEFGGNFSSKPINITYVGAKYRFFRRFGATLLGNVYFGHLYNSAQAVAKIDFPFALPFFLQTDFTLNSFNYYRSNSFFFERSQTYYIINNENFFDNLIGFPISHKGKGKIGLKTGNINSKYFQISNFSDNDTTDKTSFNFTAPYLLYERNTQNYKMLPTRGTNFLFNLKYVYGQETTTPGSTSFFKTETSKQHQWLQAKFAYENYFMHKGFLTLGFNVEAFYSTQSPFNNYKASVIMVDAYQPIVETKGIFIEQLRAAKYLAGGFKFIFNLSKSFHIRAEQHMFQPYQELLADAKNQLVYGLPFARRYIFSALSFVHHSPLGPISLSVNYYDISKKIDNKYWSFLFNIGYMIFNKKALH